MDVILARSQAAENEVHAFRYAVSPSTARFFQPRWTQPNPPFHKKNERSFAILLRPAAAAAGRAWETTARQPRGTHSCKIASYTAIAGVRICSYATSVQARLV